MLVPYVIYGSTALRTQKRETEFLIPLMIISMVFSFWLASIVRLNLFDNLVDLLVSGILLWCLMAVIVALIINSFYKSTLFGLDICLASKYPGHMASLRNLAEIGGVPELGPPLAADRLRRLQNAMLKQAVN